MVGPNKHSRIDTHILNAVTLVWGSLRLAPMDITLDFWEVHPQTVDTMHFVSPSTESLGTRLGYTKLGKPSYLHMDCHT